MAKNVLPKHWNGSEFEELHIVTKASNVLTEDNKSVQQKMDDFTAHLAENMPHLIKDITNNKTYRYGIQVKDGVTQFIYEEVL